LSGKWHSRHASMIASEAEGWDYNGGSASIDPRRDLIYLAPLSAASPPATGAGCRRLVPVRARWAAP
jgi:hypothetical protein